MPRSLALGVVLSLVAVAAAAQPPSESTTVRLDVPEGTSLEWLSRQVSIDDVRGTEVVAVASPEQLARLREAGITWTVVPKATVAATMCPTGWEVDPKRSWSCYPTYDQYVAFMEQLVDAHSLICRLERLSPTTNAERPHELLALVITDRVRSQEDEPEILLTSSMHGDETAGFVLLLRLAEELLSSYGSDGRLTALVNETEIWINPLANPDGTYFAGDDDVSGAIRFYTTSAGSDSSVDPNRNFADPDEGDHPDGRQWWIETETMMSLGLEQSFTLSANFHGGAEVINYPWDTWPRRHPDDDALNHLARAWATAAQEDGPSGYMRDLDNGVTNGWDWYPVAGGRQDFMTFFARGREVTVELSRTKLVPAEQLDELWSSNRRALYGFLLTALQGIRGVVTDPDGRPLPAIVEIVGRDTEQDRSAVRTDPDVGDYHRLVLPGTYDLRIAADGYVSEEVGGVAVLQGDATVVDVVLHPAVAVDVSGTVLDAAGRPIADAVVEIAAGDLEPARTGADGSYRLDGVPPGEHLFVVSARGYHTLEARRDVDGGAEIQDFVLQAAFRAPPRSIRLIPVGPRR